MTGSLSIIGPLDEADFSLNGEELTAGSLIQVVGDINLNISETDDPNWFIYVSFLCIFQLVYCTFYSLIILLLERFFSMVAT